MVSAEHRSWGQNYEQTWVEDAWTEGFTSSYSRMVEEATEAGAHGIVGVVDTSHPWPTWACSSSRSRAPRCG